MVQATKQTMTLEAVNTRKKEQNLLKAHLKSFLFSAKAT